MKRAVLLLSIAIASGCTPAQRAPFTGELQRAARHLDDLTATAEDYGLPMTPDELIGPKIPDAENAAYGLLPILEAWQSARNPLKPSQAARLTVLDPRPVDVAAVDDQMIRQLESQFDRPGWQSDRDWPNLLFISANDFILLSIAARAVGWRAVERARAGDEAGCLDDLRFLRQISKLIRQEPSPYAVHFSSILESDHNLAALDCAHVWRSRPDQIAKLREEIDADFRPISAWPAMRGSFFGTVSFARNLNAYGGLPAVDPNDEKYWSYSGYSGVLKTSGEPDSLGGRAITAMHLRTWIKGLRQHNHGMMRVAQTIDSLSFDEDQENPPDYAVFYGSSVHPVEPVVKTVRRHSARHDLTLAALKVLEHRARTGGLPTTLEQAGARGWDRILGQQLLYEVKRDAFAVWIPGEDHIDKGSGLSGAKALEEMSIIYPPKNRRVCL